MTKYLQKSHKQTKKLKIRVSVLFLFIMALFSLQAKELNAQTVSLNLKEVSVANILDQIETRFSYQFVFRIKSVDLDRKISISVDKKPIEVVLKQIFNNTKTAFKVEGHKVLLFKKVVARKQVQQQFIIKGVVKDEKGEPIPGVSIYVSNNEPKHGVSRSKDFIVRGTTTDFDGKFSLKVSLGYFLGIASLNYKFQYQKITNQQQKYYTIVLKEAENKLKEVVLVGYGTQEREEVSSAISTIKQKEIRENVVGISSFDRGLSGLLSGVKITQGSGRPGSSVDINIRGVTSPFSGGDNNPLFVIDGVPFQANPTFTADLDASYATVENPLLSINPNDIESISVLKDASATAIYGSRGANGVIIVKTKRGKRNERMSVQLSGITTFARPINTLDYLTTKEWKIYNDEVFKNSVAFANSHPALGLNRRLTTWNYLANLTVDPTTNQLRYNGLKQDFYGKANTNWADEVYRKPAATQRYNITIQGGGHNTNYLIGAGYTNQEGLLLNEKLKQYNFRTAIDTQINSFLSMGITANIGTSNNKTGYSDSNNNLNQQLNARPDLPAKDAKGNYVRLPGKAYGFYDSFAANPLALVTGNVVENKGFTFTGNAYAEAKLLKNFTLRTDINISRFATDGSTFAPVSIVGRITPALTKDESSLTKSRVVNMNLISNIRGDYRTTIRKHTLGAMVGFSWDRSSTDRSNFYMVGFPDDEVLTNISSAAKVFSQAGIKVETGLNSFFTRLSYNYDHRYFLTVNFRTDKSIKFGPGNQRAYFPSLAASWNIANESFLKNNKIINNLRLRTGLGRTGSNNIGNFEYLQFFSIVAREGGKYNGNPAIGLTGTLPNRNIKWETTDEVNIGLDFGLFNNRLKGSVDVYHRKTTGALMGALYPLETGASSFTANLAELTNKGVEISVGGDIIRTTDFNWAVNFNISQNKNTLDKFSESSMNNRLRRYYELGKEVNLIKGYRVEKIFQESDQAEIDKLNANVSDGFYQQQGTAPGDYKYADVNGDGKITADDWVYLGSSQADFFGGFNTVLSYKDLELSTFFSFSKGGEAIISLGDPDNIYPSPGRNVLRRFTDRWTPSHTNAKYPRAVITDPNRNYQISDRLVYDTSYLRLKNIQLSYTLPTEVLKSAGLDKVSLFVAASNVWTLTNYPGIDPESVGGAASASSNSSRDPYPIAKTWSLGVNISF